jgi:hypothetical protein
MAADLSLCERTERHDGDPVAADILDRLSHQSLADLAASRAAGTLVWSMMINPLPARL